jgi:autotransporter-associated beta strand protein
MGGAVVGSSCLPAIASTTYTFNSFTSGSDDWNAGSNWTATSGPANAKNTPGGDPGILDDSAVIAYNAPGAAGAVVVNLNAPTPAATVSAATISLLSGVSTDTLALNLNAPLAVTGNMAVIGGANSANKYGKASLTVAAGTTLTVGGTLSASGADGYGSSTITVNGNLTAAATQLLDDGDNIVVGTTAGVVTLGNFTLARSASSGLNTSSSGLHLNGGTISAGSFTIGTGSSSGVAVIAGANVTISGSFIVGDPQTGTANTSRPSTMYQTSGNVFVTASTGLALGAATVVTGSSIASAGTYNLSGGSLTIPTLQMTGSGSTSPATNKATFALSGGATLNIGSGGITLGTGNATFTSTGGTLAAVGSWTHPYTGNMSLSSGNTTFQAGDAAGNPFDLSFSGPLTGGGMLIKTGAGNLTLTSSSSYSGGTYVNGGTLYVNNTANSGTGSSFVQVANGTLAGHGIISSSVDVAAGAHLAPGVNNVGTLTLGYLTLESGSVTDFDFSSTANSLVTLTSGMTINGGGINLYQQGTTTPFTTDNTYTLFTFTGGATVPTNYASLQILNGVSGFTYTFGTTSTAITLTISGSAGGPVTWAADANGSWSTAANWGNNTIPGAANSVIFGSAITAARTITLDGNRTVTSILFNNPNAYTLAPGSGTNANSSLTLDNGTATATLSDTSGNHSITAPLILNSPTVVTVSNLADTLTLSGGIHGAGNITLTGLGTVALSGSTSGTITLSGGTLAPIGPLTAGNLTTTANATLGLALTSPTTANTLLSVTGTLTLDGGTFTINSQATTGSASLGYYKILSYGSLSGLTTSITLPAPANNIAYTLDATHDAGFIDLHCGYIGDANDDGKVDLSDLNIVLNNLGTAATSWGKGNFDGAATIDLTDLNDVLNHLGTSIASGAAVVAVPEPASLGILVLGVSGVLLRRRNS